MHHELLIMSYDGHNSEKIENTKRAIRSHNSKDRQYNGQKKKVKWTKRELQNTTQKTKDQASLSNINMLSEDIEGAVVAMTAWQLDLQLSIQSVPITTDVVMSNLDQGEVYNIM